MFTAAGLATISPDASAATVAYYRFEGGTPGTTGGSVADSSGNGLDGRANGPVYRDDVPADRVLGQPNARSMEFTGARSEAVSIPDDPRFQLTHSLTVEAFIKPRAYPGVAGDIVFRGDERFANDSFVLNLFQGQLRFAVLGPSGESIVSTPADKLFGHWTHVAGTLDDATGKQSLYVNGVLMDSRVTPVRALGPLDPASQPGVGIGGTQAGTYDQGYSGWIDEVRISNESLLPGQFLPEPSAAGMSLGFSSALLLRRRRARWSDRYTRSSPAPRA